MDTDTGSTAIDPQAIERARRARSGAYDPPGEWLFERAGDVFGPVGVAHLMGLFEEGRVDAATRIRREGEAWRALGAVPELVQPLREARTRMRAAAEARRAAQRARWNASARWTALTLLIGGLVVVVAATAAYLSVRRPWQERSALLSDFGPSVTVDATRVTQGRGRDGAREIAVPDLRPTDGRRSVASAPGTAKRGAEVKGPVRGDHGAAGARDENAIVAARFDPASIDRVVERHKDGLAACVRDEARRSPDLAGAIPLEFAIGNDGRVVELWIDDARFKSGPLHDCLMSALQRLPFEPFSGQRPVVSLSFRIAAR